jgi:O-antigen ligase
MSAAVRAIARKSPSDLLLVCSLTLAIAGAIPFTSADGVLQPLTRGAFLAGGYMALALAARQSGTGITAAWRHFPLPLAAFLLWCCLTSLWSVNVPTTVLRITESAVTFLYFQSFVFLLALGSRSIADCANVLAMAFGASVIMGLLVNAIMFGTPFHFWLNPDVPDRPRFTFGFLHPLATGDMLAIGILATLFTSWHLAPKILSIIALFALLRLSDSTGARFAVLALIPVIFLLYGQKPVHHAVRFLMAALVACLILLAMSMYNTDLVIFGGATEDNTRLLTLTGRVQIWNAIFQNGLASSPFGYGFEAARFVIGPLIGRSYHAHNLYLNVLVETGAIGFILFSVLLLTWLSRLVRYGTLFPWILCLYVLLISVNNPGMFTKQSIMLIFLASYYLPAFFPRRPLRSTLWTSDPQTAPA